MKKLVAVTVLGLSLGFSALSFAQGQMDVYTNVSAPGEVSSEIRGGEVETSPMSFYLSPVKEQSNGTLRTVEWSESDENAFYVFGIRI